MHEPKDNPLVEQLRAPHLRVLCWWDRTIVGTTMGTLLILLTEGRLVARLCNAGAIDVAVNAASEGMADIGDGEWRSLEPDQCRGAALSVLAGLEAIDKIYACGGDAGFQALSSELTGTHLSWPLEGRNLLPSPYDTTKYVHLLWKEVGKLDTLKFHANLREWAQETIQLRFCNLPTVGLHLKNVDHQGPDSISLANTAVWHEFLSAACQQYEIGFMLLGDDPVDDAILKLPNIALAREMGASNFAKHLALLGQCDGFMGMMSAIANGVLFSGAPYAIFKNPSHHRNEMLMEIGVNDHYAFATQDQRVLRVKETPALLLAELKRMPFVDGKLR